MTLDYDDLPIEISHKYSLLDIFNIKSVVVEGRKIYYIFLNNGIRDKWTPIHSEWECIRFFWKE